MRREARLRKETLQFAFESLLEHTQDSKRADQLLRKAATKLVKMAMSAAFSGWATTFQRRQVVKKRAASAMQGSVLFCFEKWADACAEIEAAAQLQISKFLRYRSPKMRGVCFRAWLARLGIPAMPPKASVL